MLFNDFCTKIIYWPYLAHLAIMKGICPANNLTTSTTTSLPITMSIQPTFHSIPMFSTTPSCPLEAVVCLDNGKSPLKFCPCIDPRNLESKLQMSSLKSTNSSRETVANFIYIKIFIKNIIIY